MGFTSDRERVFLLIGAFAITDGSYAIINNNLNLERESDAFNLRTVDGSYASVDGSYASVDGSYARYH